MNTTRIPRRVQREIRHDLAEIERILRRQYAGQTRRRILIAGPSGALVEVFVAPPSAPRKGVTL